MNEVYENGKLISYECSSAYKASKYSLEYHDNGELKKFIEHWGKDCFVYEYDEKGRDLSKTQNGVLVESFKYNEDGTKIVFEYRDGRKILEKVYDKNGRLVLCKHQDGSMNNDCYDEYGRCISRSFTEKSFGDSTFKSYCEIIEYLNSGGRIHSEYSTNLPSPESLIKRVEYDALGRLVYLYKSSPEGDVTKKVSYVSHNIHSYEETAGKKHRKFIVKYLGGSYFRLEYSNGDIVYPNVDNQNVSISKKKIKKDIKIIESNGHNILWE